MNGEHMNEKYYDVVIIGANISGILMALRVEQEKNPLCAAIFESSDADKRLENSDKIPFYINRCVDIPHIEWKHREIKTQMWDNYSFCSEPNELQKAAYAQKITGRICKTTLDNITYAKTIFIPSDLHTEGRQKVILSSTYKNLKTTIIRFNRRIIEVDMINNEIHDDNGNTTKYKYLISTIPLPQFFSLAKISTKLNLPCYKKDFYINIKNVSQLEKYHVIYCADPQVRINRIAYLGDKLYMESPEKLFLEALNSTEQVFVEHSKEVFGLTDLSFDFENAQYPRFVENDLDETNRLIAYLKEYGIYLLGRYANWRFLLTEDIWDKTKEIICEIGG